MHAAQVVELSQMKFYPDQLQLLFQAGVLVGVHGAALTNQVWLPPAGGGLVELWHGMSDNYHYHNMAHMLLHAYASVQTPQTEDGGYQRDANATAVAQAVAWAMQEVAWRRSRQRRRFWQSWGDG
jgi:capsular polysaccharide biosynthesis protein